MKPARCRAPASAGAEHGIHDNDRAASGFDGPARCGSASARDPRADGSPGRAHRRAGTQGAPRAGDRTRVRPVRHARAPHGVARRGHREPSAAAARGGSCNEGPATRGMGLQADRLGKEARVGRARSLSIRGPRPRTVRGLPSLDRASDGRTHVRVCGGAAGHSGRRGPAGVDAGPTRARHQLRTISVPARSSRKRQDAAGRAHRASLRRPILRALQRVRRR